jgi:hypothetical protein
MKVIEIPVSVVLKPWNEQMKAEEMSFKKWALLHIDTYSEVKAPGQIRQCFKIASAMESAGSTVQLEDADYDLLKAACSQPKLMPGASRQLVAYFDAIDAAQDVKKATDK